VVIIGHVTGISGDLRWAITGGWKDQVVEIVSNPPLQYPRAVKGP
jgi:hypothetical protein